MAVSSGRLRFLKYLPMDFLNIPTFPDPLREEGGGSRGEGNVRPLLSFSGGSAWAHDVTGELHCSTARVCKDGKTTQGRSTQVEGDPLPPTGVSATARSERTPSQEMEGHRPKNPF